jgi:peptide/nickel transport system substrate-binding protein
VNYAVDKKAIINDLYLGYPGDLPGQLLAEDGFGHNPDIEPYPYDPEKAKELLAEAGYPDGFDTQFEVFGGNISAGETAGEAVAAYLADVGINAEIVPLEGQVWIQKWYGGGRAPLFMGWANYLPLYDADFSYNWFWSQNQPEGARYLKNDRFDELFVAQRGELDPEKREEMLQEMAAIHHEEAPVIYLFRQGRAHVMSPKVKGLELRPDQMFYVDYVSLEEE